MIELAIFCSSISVLCTLGFVCSVHSGGNKGSWVLFVSGLSLSCGLLSGSFLGLLFLAYNSLITTPINPMIATIIKASGSVSVVIFSVWFSGLFSRNFKHISREKKSELNETGVE